MHLIIGDGVQHLAVYPAGIVSVYDLAHKPEIGFYGISGLAQLFHELEIKDISTV